MRYIVVIAAAFCATLCGCGSEFPIAPVSGIVTVDGEPVAGLSVQFSPQTANAKGEVGFDAAGVTDEEGRYELIAADPTGCKRSATVGLNSVLIAPAGKEIIPGVVEQDFSLLPEGVSFVQTTFDVPKRGTKKADFALPLPEAENAANEEK